MAAGSWDDEEAAHGVTIVLLNVEPAILPGGVYQYEQWPKAGMYGFQLDLPSVIKNICFPVGSDTLRSDIPQNQCCTLDLKQA